MANDVENNDSPNVEQFDVTEIDSIEDIETLRAKVKEFVPKITDTNKQLFARAKKAEGFELKDGKWVKPPKADAPPEEKPSKPSELEYGQLALLRTEGIKGSGEIALFKEIMAETGKGVLDVLDSNYFKSRLTDFRDAQASQNAIPKGKNRSGQAGVTDEDVAVAKFHETGKLPDDFKTRNAVRIKLVEAEKSKNMFTGPAVVGPQEQVY